MAELSEEMILKPKKRLLRASKESGKVKKTE